MRIFLKFGMLVFLMCVSSSSFAATNFKLDLDDQFDSLGIAAPDDAVTGLMSQVSFVQDIDVIQVVDPDLGIPVPGSTFTQDGVGFADSFTFLDVLNDSEGLNTAGGFQLTFVYNFTGVVTSFDVATGIFYEFLSGGIDVYVHNVSTRTPNINVHDPKFTNEYSGYDSGIKIAELGLDSGSGSIGLNGEGSSFINFKFVDNSNYYNTWLDEFGNDLVANYAGISWMFAVTDTTQKNLEIFDVDRNSLDGLPAPGLNEVLLSSTGNGGMELSIVPEPTSILLLGFGLLGLAGISRKNRRP